tara:strand:+ start:11190 stop:12782 length:1593 start_codon:yes stop_codon:yes gene_type:complete
VSARELITENLDLWTGAVTKKSSSGRGSNGKVELTGVKKLRELILELAIRGRLVEQDSSDEPAHLVLEQLDSSVKKNKGKPRASSGASQPILPKGWSSFRVGDYLDFQYGKSLPAKQRDDSGSIAVYGSNGVVGFHTEALTEASCIIVGRKGSAGALNKALDPSWTTDVAYYVQPPQGFDFEFTYLLLQSLHLDRLGKGIKPGVNRNEAYSLTALLPPLEEQHRIVQKVDELMALCDQLEQQISDQLEAHETLVDTLLGTLTQFENATELADNWARLAAHFDTLFTTEQSIDKLKQTILQLAVMGRLVEQNSKDEPAPSFLQRHGIKNHADSLQGWAEVVLGDLGGVIGGSTPSKAHAEFWDGTIPWVSPKDMKRPLIQDSQDKISEQAVELTSLKIVPPHSLLMVVRGMILAHSFPVAITGCEVTINQDMKALVPPPEITPYLLLCLQAARSTIIELVDRSSHGTRKLVSEKLWSHVIRIPPIDEQLRIIQKVDDLMALCDQLKERLSQARETRCHLAEAALADAVGRC